MMPGLQRADILCYFPTRVITIAQRYRRADRQTDGQTDNIFTKLGNRTEVISRQNMFFDQ